MSRVVDFVDTTTRDGNQSLWSATGLTTPDVLAIAPTMDRVGYHALDFTSHQNACALAANGLVDAGLSPSLPRYRIQRHARCRVEEGS